LYSNKQTTTHTHTHRMSSACTTSAIRNAQYYTTTIIDPCGIMFNLICVICLSQILWHKSESNQAKTSNLFKYLLVKAVCDFVALSIEVFTAFELRDPTFYRFLSFNIFYVYFYHDIEQVLLMLSALMEVVATLGILFNSRFSIKFLSLF
jgi:hypothetical protein